MKSFYDHHGMEQVDAYEMELETGGYPGEDLGGTAQPRCNRCHDYNVRWRQQGGRWVLFSSRAGVPHACVATASDFAPVRG